MLRIASFAAAMVAASFALGGCASLSNPNSVTTTTNTIIATIQQDTAALCSVVPAAADVGVLISGQNPVAISVAAIAQAICSAFKAQAPAASVTASKRFGAVLKRKTVYVVSVNGIPVHVAVTAAPAHVPAAR